MKTLLLLAVSHAHDVKSTLATLRDIPLEVEGQSETPPVARLFIANAKAQLRARRLQAGWTDS